jgi:uncharacterized protein DUF4268
MDKGTVQFNIDRGPDKKEETDQIYEAIYSDREKIEGIFGEPLEWNKKEGRNVCRIISYSEIGGLKNEDQWNEIQDDMIARLERLENALKASLEKI